MYRRIIEPRPNWPTRLEHIGLSYHSVDGGYWREDATYEFSELQIDVLESATTELHQLCLDAVERIIVENRFADLSVPDPWAARIIESWERQEASLYGRFDLWYDGVGHPKLLEYNADTPTALLETAVAQWFWLMDVSPEADQFNSVHEKLIARWATLRRRASADLIHLTCLDQYEEDRQTVLYLADTASQAGWRVQTIPIEQIGWDRQRRCFVDQLHEPIVVLFKLYPWEWLHQDAFASFISCSAITMMEPAWKQLLSNKGVLALLWEWFPDHPNLLPAFFKRPKDSTAYVSKPFWSREGANITVATGKEVLTTSGPYGDQPAVYQNYHPLPEFAGWHPVIGSWVIGDEPAGMGIREDRGFVHGNLSRFVPHRFLKEVPVS